VSPGLQKHDPDALSQSHLQFFGDHAPGVDPDADELHPDRLEAVEQGRECRMLHDHLVPEPQQFGHHLIHRVHGAVHHGEPVRPIWPVAAEDFDQLRQRRVVEVAVQRGSLGNAPQRCRQVGQQRRIGHTGGEIEFEQ